MTGNGKWWNTRVGRQWWQESWLFSTTLWALEDWKMEGGWMQAAKVSNDPSFSRARPIFHNLPNLPLLHILSNLTSPSHISPHFPIRSNKNVLQQSYECNRGPVNPNVLLMLPKKESLLHQDAFQLHLSVSASNRIHYPLCLPLWASSVKTLWSHFIVSKSSVASNQTNSFL